MPKPQKLQKLHLIIVMCFSPTSSRAARVRIISDHFEQYVTIPKNSPKDNAIEMAQLWLEKRGFIVTGFCVMRDNMSGLLSTTFKPLKS